MENAASAKQTITYRELVDQITALSYQPYDDALSDLLSHISRQDNAKGRGMLSAVVIHAGGDRLPGDGFFDLAKELGRTFTDRKKFWRSEVATVFKHASGGAESSVSE